ncbi:MAG: hypothetical protein HONBIEJF_02724 [Fimbriimonadaceae bacterium]|nr:hypothetical protein [Fimbriimonadaceae bacterium]
MDSPYRALILEGRVPTGSREETARRQGRAALRLLRARRRRLGLTLAELALTTGISTASLHRYETGARLPSAVELSLVAAALRVTQVEVAALSTAPEQLDDPQDCQDLVPLFLDETGRGPVATYLALDRLARQGGPDPKAAGSIVHGLMLMGDHEGLSENWSTLRPSFPRSFQVEPNLVRAVTSLAIVRARQGQVVDYGRLRSLARSLPHDEGYSVAMLNVIRAATYSGELELALGLLDQVEEYATRRDPTLLFQTELSRLLLEPPSSSILERLARLRDQAPSQLHCYLANVALADRAHSCGSAEVYREALQHCARTEAVTGLGSPLIRGLR